MSVFLLLTGLKGLTQQPPWQHIGAGQGLPDASITCIHRVNDGTLIGGTHDGFVMMEGTRFTRVTTSDDLTSQVNPFIYCLTSGKDGILYAGSRNALWRYDRIQKKLSTVIHPWGMANGIQHLAFSSDSSYLMASTYKGLLKIPQRKDQFDVTDSLAVMGAAKSWMINGQWYVYSYQRMISRFSGRMLIPVVRFPGILDVLWIGNRQQWLVLTSTGIDLFSIDGMKLHSITNLFKPGDLPGVPSMYSDGNGVIYIPVLDGLLHMDGMTLKCVFKYFPEQGNDYTLGNASVAYFYKDLTGVSWVSASGAGLNYISQPPGDLLFLSNNFLKCTTTWSLFFDSLTSKLWIGTDHGIRFGDFDGNHFYSQKNLKPLGVSKFTVTGIRPLNHNEMLVSTFGHGCWLANRVTGTLRPVNAVNRLLKNKNLYGSVSLADGRSLILTQTGIIVWKPGASHAYPFLPDETDGHFALSACQMRDGRILIGDGLGLLCTKADETIQWRLQNKPGDTASVSSNVIIHITELSDNTVALGTMGGGLSIFDPSSKRFRRIRLATNPVNVYGTIEIVPGTLLLTTSHGLCLYHSRGGVSTMLNQDNILPFNDFNQFAIGCSEKNIFAAGEKGVVMIRKAGLPELFRSPEKIVIHLNSRRCDSIVLPPGISSAEVTIALANSLPNKKMKFLYRLDGYEKNWHELPPGLEQVVYNFIPPGRYKFAVKGADINNFYRAEPSLFPVIVRPHFWQTPIFRVLMGIILLSFVVFLVRYFSWIRLTRRLRKIEDEQKLSRERARISRELHDNVGSQLTYIISGLEASGYLLKRNMPEKLAGDLRSLQDSARESMQQLRQAIWALNQDEITPCALAMQFRGWLQRVMEPHPEIEWKMVEDTGADFIFDPLTGLNLFRMMQESVHNVIKHAGKCTLDILMETSGDRIIISITDSGNGFEPGTPEGNGLGSMRARAMETGIQLEHRSLSGEGTRVIITKTVK